VTTFSGLFQAYSRDVYRFALFLSGDHDVAEDIASETFARVWHARERLDLTPIAARVKVHRARKKLTRAAGASAAPRLAPGEPR
jgi:hypothetical protein